MTVNGHNSGDIKADKICFLATATFSFKMHKGESLCSFKSQFLTEVSFSGHFNTISHILFE